MITSTRSWWSTQFPLPLVQAGDEYPLVYHNGLGWTRYQYVQVKVSTAQPLTLRVFDADGNAVPVQTSPAHTTEKSAKYAALPRRV